MIERLVSFHGRKRDVLCCNIHVNLSKDLLKSCCALAFSSACIIRESVVVCVRYRHNQNICVNSCRLIDCKNQVETHVRNSHWLFV